MTRLNAPQEKYKSCTTPGSRQLALPRIWPAIMPNFGLPLSSPTPADPLLSDTPVSREESRVVGEFGPHGSTINNNSPRGCVGGIHDLIENLESTKIVLCLPKRNWPARMPIIGRLPFCDMNCIQLRILVELYSGRILTEAQAESQLQKK